VTGAPRSYELGEAIDTRGPASWTFSGRAGGVSSGRYASLNVADHVGDDPAAVSQNRAILGATVGASPDHVAIMQAAHGRDAAVVTAGGLYPAVDILVTGEPGIALMTLAADCATVVLVDRSAALVAAVHSGWRGVAVDAVGAAVAQLERLGAAPGRIQAALGPAICPGCYEVSTQVQAEVARAAPASAAVTRKGTPAINLHAGIREQLNRAGVVDLVADPTCTAESADLFSHRRDGVTGRHAAVVRLTDARP
jgi:polyphenol oxidase